MSVERAPDRRRAGIAASGVAAILWGFGGIFAVLISAPGLVLTFYRLWIGAALLIALLLGSGRKLSVATLRASWLGGLLLTGDFAMFFSSLKLTSVVDATVIGALQPVLVIVAARHLFGEKLRRRDIVWVAIAVLGVIIAVLGTGSHGHHQVEGDLLATGALVCWSAYWITSKHVRRSHDALQYSACVFLVAAIAVTPIVLISGESLRRVQSGDWLWIALLVTLPGSGHLVMNWAHRFVDASISSAISCLSPFVAAVAAAVILGQSLTVVQTGGVLIGLVAIAIIASRQRGVVERPPE